MADQIKEQKLPTMTYRARVPVFAVGDSAPGEEEIGTAFKDSAAFTRANDMLAHIVLHQLEQSDLIDIQLGGGQLIGFGGTDRPKEHPDTVTYKATIPMPSEMVEKAMAENVERLRGTVSDSFDVGRVGDKETGRVLIRPPEEGLRWALSEKGFFDYQESFPEDMPMDEVLERVVQDIATIMCEEIPVRDPDTYINHVCSHDLSPKEIDTAEMEDNSMLYSRTIAPELA